MQGRPRANGALSVQRRPDRRLHGTLGDRLCRPADRRPERRGYREHYQKPRGGVLRQAQLPVSVCGVDFARRDSQ